MTYLPTFSRAMRQLHVFTPSFDRFPTLCVFLGQLCLAKSDYFGFVSKRINWTPLVLQPTITSISLYSKSLQNYIISIQVFLVRISCPSPDVHERDMLMATGFCSQVTHSFTLRMQFVIFISELNLPYLKKSKETNKNVKNICYRHCWV